MQGLISYKTICLQYFGTNLLICDTTVLHSRISISCVVSTMTILGIRRAINLKGNTTFNLWMPANNNRDDKFVTRSGRRNQKFNLCQNIMNDINVLQNCTYFHFQAGILSYSSMVDAIGMW